MRVYRAVAVLLSAACSDADTLGDEPDAGSAVEDGATWALVFSETNEGQIAAGADSLRALTRSVGEASTTNERGEAVGETFSRSVCLTTAATFEGDVLWQRALSAPTRNVFTSAIHVDGFGATWLACFLSGDAPATVSLPPLSSAVDGETTGVVARLDANGAPELLEANTGYAFAFASWLDGRVAIAHADNTGSITVEWRSAQGSTSSTVVLPGTLPVKLFSLQIAAANDVDDDVILNSFGPSSPNELPFLSGQVAAAEDAGSLVARVAPGGVIWAAAFDEDFRAATAPAVTWLSAIDGTFLLTGRVGEDAFVDVVTGDVLLPAESDGPKSFIATVDDAGRVSDIVRFTTPGATAWATQIGGRRFAVGETSGDDPFDQRFSIAATSPQLESTALRGDGFGVSPNGLVAGGDDLYAAFAMSFNGVAGDVDITPYVPDSLVRPSSANTFVLARIVTP